MTYNKDSKKGGFSSEREYTSTLTPHLLLANSLYILKLTSESTLAALATVLQPVSLSPPASS